MYDDIHVLHLVWNFEHLQFFHKLTPTLTLMLSLVLGLGLAWGHFEDKNFSCTQLLKIFAWTSTTIFIFCIWFQILNPYRFRRS